MRLIKTAFFTLIPSLACYFLLWISEVWSRYAYISNEIILVPYYLLTVLYIVLFILKNFDKLAILPVSFILTPASAFIYESLNPSKFQYLATYLIAMFYALPFFIITAITVIIVKRRRARK